MKYYFAPDSEYDNMCFQLDYWKQYMKEYSLNELVLFEAKRETGLGMFFCKEFGEIRESRISCGKQCDAYKPNNGRNGRCRHYGYCYEMTDVKLVLKKK